MKQFEPCPITGLYPNWGMDGETLVRWWNEVQIPELTKTKDQQKLATHLLIRIAEIVPLPRQLAADVNEYFDMEFGDAVKVRARGEG